MRMRRAMAALAVLAVLTAQRGPAVARDPNNPTCPATPDLGPSSRMTLTPRDVDGRRVLIAEGVIDESLPERLQEILNRDEMIGEIWLKSRGGDARSGNAAGRVIRAIPGMLTRIPAGWTCFSACNFVFMGGDRRIVDPGGVFMVHMFTHTGDRTVISESVLDGTQATAELISEIEQSSAMLASEDNDFLIRMGISRKLLTEVMYRQQAVGTSDNPGTRYCLSQAEVREYNVMPVEARAN